MESCDRVGGVKSGPIHRRMLQTIQILHINEAGQSKSTFEHQNYYSLFWILPERVLRSMCVDLADVVRKIKPLA